MRPILIALALTLAACNSTEADQPASDNEAQLTAKANADVAAALAESTTTESTTN